MPDTAPRIAPRTAARTAPGPGLLEADDPAPYGVLNPEGGARFVLVCDHARNAVPRALSGLGIDGAEIARHIGWDIGAAALTRALAKMLDAKALVAGYSRLVIDCNRALDDPTSIPEISDGTIVAGNRGLSDAARTARAEAIFRPYHAAVATELAARLAGGAVPALVSIHSYTPSVKGRRRPWHVGVTWDKDPRLAVPFMARLRGEAGIEVGDNRPFSGRTGYGYTCGAHATAQGLPELLIEVRQDLIETTRGVTEWSAIVGRVLADTLAGDEVYRVERFR